MYTSDQHADLLISEVEHEHFSKTDEFLNLARFRPVFEKHFKQAQQAAIEQAIKTVKAAQGAGIEDIAPHLEKHLP